MLVFSEKITVSQILKFQQQLIEAFLNSTDMSEENKESPIVPVSMDSWVEWFRSVAPHIHSIRGKTIVIDLAGETILQEHFSSLIADISMISAIGARIVLVYGVRPQVEELMSLKAIESQYVNGIRVTTADALVCVKEAAGEARLDIEAAFSQGLPNTPMAHSQCRVVSGNFVIARPLGIIDGVDFKFTGVVRKVDSEAIHRELDGGRIVLISPLGFSPTGEAFNLTSEDLAASIAGALKADKLILLTNVDGVRRFDEVVTELTAEDAREFINDKLVDEEDIYNLTFALKALEHGVERVHIVPYAMDGGLLAELFTHDGVGTMMTMENLESLRQATSDDVSGLIKLLEPLEADGTLVKRPREKLERDISHFTVLEHDGVIYGSAALYQFPEEKLGEMAALTVDAAYQGFGDGERLLRHIENQARKAGLNRLFVLTTRTMHWFLKRGFRPAGVDYLPIEKRRLYNWQRRSQIFLKDL